MMDTDMRLINDGSGDLEIDRHAATPTEALHAEIRDQVSRRHPDGHAPDDTNDVMWVDRNVLRGAVASDETTWVDIPEPTDELLAAVEAEMPWEAREDSDARYRDDQAEYRQAEVDGWIAREAERIIDALAAAIDAERAEWDASVRSGLLADLATIHRLIREDGHDPATVDLDVPSALRDDLFGWAFVAGDEHPGVVCDRVDGRNRWTAWAMDAESTVLAESFDIVEVDESDLVAVAS